MRKIVWYQFSDLHFRSSTQFDRKIVLEALWKDVSNQMGKGRVPNFLTVTGDIAWSGRDSEFALANAEFFEPLINLTGVERSDVFVVPGNHDVDRDALSDLNPAKIAAIIDRDSLNDFQSNSRVLARYLASFESYNLFQGRFGKRSLSNALGYHHFLNLSGVRMALIGLNTSWSSGYAQIPGRGNSEQGYLTIGEYQLRSLLPNPADADFTVALMHHPVSWLADFDRATIEPIIADSCDIVLHGHVHRPSDIAEIRGLRGSYLSLGSGASYERRAATEAFVNSYSIIELDPDQRKVSVILRKYSDSPIPAWTSHEDPFGEGSGGVKVFSIPTSIAQNGAPEALSKRSVVSFGSIGDIYRSLPNQAQYLMRAASVLKADSKSPIFALSNVYEECVLSWSNTVELEPTLDVAAAILLSCTILTSAERKPEFDLDALIKVASERCGGIDDCGALVTAVAKAAACWRALLSDFEAPPHELTQETDLGRTDPLAVAPVFLALSLLLLSDVDLAASVTGKSIPNRTAAGDLVVLQLPASARVKGSIVSISVVAPTLAEFSPVSIIRQYLDLKIDQLVDVFSAVNEQFSVSSLTLHFIERPEEWTEHRFSVDPTRVMRLLMGDALYGKQSADVWFRELLQNAVDATAARARIDKNADYSRNIRFGYDAFDRRVFISDNGIGMTGDHIVRFFCKAGRSIWRSEELKAYATTRSNDATRSSIGKFGVGVLSMFQSSDRIQVTTRFFREDNGSGLEISNLEQPFFLQKMEGAPVGTEISLHLKEGYTVDVAQLVDTYLTYAPREVQIEGLGQIPEDADAALDAMIQRTTRGWDGGSRSVHWETASIALQKLNATLKVAVPLISSTSDSGHDRARGAEPTRIRVSNGGVTVLEKVGLWLGEPTPGRQEPKLDVTGLHVLLDFSAGAAPVTVSRNTMSLTEADAHAIIGEARNAVIAAWKSHAERLFQASDAEVATKRLLKMLCNSAAPPSYLTRGWSADLALASAAKDLLQTHGVLRVEEGGVERKSRFTSVRDLVDSGRPLAILSEGQRDNQLIHLYASKVQNFSAIYGSSQREIALIGTCSSRWSRLASEEDLWAAMRIEENRSLMINNFIPGDIAVVDGAYFIESEEPILILATKRERAETVEGLARADVRHIRPRVLLNADHALIRSIERAVSAREKAGVDLRRALDFLIAGVVEEKTKGRRSRRLKSVMATLAAIGEPSGARERQSGKDGRMAVESAPSHSRCSLIIRALLWREGPPYRIR